MARPEPAPETGDDYCHDCETADALEMAPWCDDPRCSERRRKREAESRVN